MQFLLSCWAVCGGEIGDRDDIIIIMLRNIQNIGIKCMMVCRLGEKERSFSVSRRLLTI